MRHVGLASMVFAVLVGLPGTARGQGGPAEEGPTPLGLSSGAPAGSYPLSDLDNVNLFNGSLNFRLPLLKIGGRGDAQVSVVLPIEQHWALKNNKNNPKQYWPRFNPGQGKRPGYSPGYLRAYRDSDTDGNRLTRLTFTSSDGTQFELRDALSDGQTGSVAGPTNRGRVFWTSDGNAATFHASQDVTDQSSLLDAASGTLYLADGIRYSIVQGQVNSILDRHGNTLFFEYLPEIPGDRDPRQRVSRIVDSLGREVLIDYVPDVSDTIRFSGFGDEERTIQVHYDFLENVVAGGGVQTLAQLFPGVNWAQPGDYPFCTVAGAPTESCIVKRFVSEVVLPHGKSYLFRYNAYGELAEVTLPTGGQYAYAWGPGQAGLAQGGVNQSVDPVTINRRVLEKVVYEGATAVMKTFFDLPLPEGPSDQRSDVRFVDPDNGADTLLLTERHYFYGRSSESLSPLPFDYPPYRHSREYKTESVAPGGTVLRRVEHTWDQARVAWVPVSNPAIDDPPNNPKITETRTTLDDGKVSRQTFAYDQYNNRLQVDEYGYGAGAPGSLQRRTVTTYETGSTYTTPDKPSGNPALFTAGPHLRRLPLTVETRDGANTLEARRSYVYDVGALTSRSPLAGYTAPGWTQRGNATSSKDWLNTTGTDLTTLRAYDVAGNVVSMTDPRNKTTIFQFDDNFGAPNGSVADNSGSQNTFAFVTLVRNPKNHETKTQFDFATGKPVDRQDPNLVVSSAEYDDPLDRPTLVSGAKGTAVETRTRFTYDDDDLFVTTNRDRGISGDGVFQVRTYFDTLGRPIQDVTYEGGLATIAAEKDYDGLGRLSRVSNPYRNVADRVWTTTLYDPLSRPTSVTSPDNAVVTTTYVGNQTTVTDQANKRRRSVTDALGRLTNVVEDPNGLAYTTDYSYDARGNLRSVLQGTQPRAFFYDSLSRLTSATNPESGTTQYTYDANGNLLTRTDSRNVVTTNTYDDLNRVLTRAYNVAGSPAVATPPLTFDYDVPSVGNPAIANAKGRLTRISSTASETTFPSYDANGRVKESHQKTPNDATGRTYDMFYGYDLSGHLTSEQYPSGRVVTTAYDDAGRPIRAGEGALAYADGVTYSPHGSVSGLRLGNGLWESTQFNDRLQPKFLFLGTSPQASNLWSLENGYGGTVNNGNVLAQIVRAPTTTGQTVAIQQDFHYDALNRLQTVSEQGTPSAWSQTYSYDRWGNRAVTGGVVPQPSLTPNLLTLYSSSNNRLSMGTVQYDAAGNMTTAPDGATHQSTYDAENRQVTYFSTSTTTYGYDGAGRRVQKTQGSASTTFVYDAFGKLLSEYGNTGAGATTYVTSDHLGSPRVTTGPTGTVLGRQDFYPFGEQIAATVHGRDMIGGYLTPPAIREKFTGKERDGESGLDYFGARYFSSPQGRFTTVDPAFNVAAHVTDPQQWNRYAYVRNNPFKYTDPDGRVLKAVTAAVKVGHALYKGYDAYSTVSGIVDATKTIFSTDARVGTLDRVKATGSLLLEVSGAIDLVKGGAKAVKAIDDVTDARKVPNPYGKAGGPEHQAKVGEVGTDLEKRGLEADYEYKVATPDGEKGSRYVDVVGIDPATGEVVEMHQIGKQTKGSLPVSRERRAIKDIKDACGMEPCFHPYNEPK